MASLFGGRPKPPDMRPVAEAQRYAAQLVDKATRRGQDLEQQRYEQSRADARPWVDAGLRALHHIDEVARRGGHVGTRFRETTERDLRHDPGYQFRLAEGEKAIRRQAAAGGSRHSGATLKALQDFAQRSGSQEFQRVDARRFRNWKADYAFDSDAHERIARIANRGYGATSDLSKLGERSTDRIVRLGVEGAKHLGAGEVGRQTTLLRHQAAQNQYKAARNRDWFQLGSTLALGAAGGFAGAGFLGAGLQGVAGGSGWTGLAKGLALGSGQRMPSSFWEKFGGT